MRVTKIGRRLDKWTVQEDGCLHHDRYWIGCRYCQHGRQQRFALAAERRHVAEVGASLREEYGSVA